MFKLQRKIKKKKNENTKNKADIETQIPMPLLQKFGTKESLVLPSTTNVRNKGF